MVFILNEKSDDEWVKWSPAVQLNFVPGALIIKPTVPNLKNSHQGYTP
jgi:hypothetical protein